MEFIKAHPREIEAYVADLGSRWENATKLNPSDVVERARRFRTHPLGAPDSSSWNKVTRQMPPSGLPSFSGPPVHYFVHGETEE